MQTMYDVDNTSPINVYIIIYIDLFYHLGTLSDFFGVCNFSLSLYNSIMLPGATIVDLEK